MSGGRIFGMSGVLSVVLAGCAVEPDTGGLVTRAEVEAMIAEADAGRSEDIDAQVAATVEAEVAAALALADCLPRSEAQATYATVDDVSTDISALNDRVGFLEDDYAPAGDLALEIADRESGDDELLALLQSDYVTIEALDARMYVDTSTLATTLTDYVLWSDLVLTLAEYALYTDAVGLANTAQTGAQDYALALFTAANVEIDTLESELSAVDATVAELDERAIKLVDSSSDISELEVTVSTEAELQQALLDLDKIHVGSDATYTIWVDSGSAIVFANPIYFRHPDGDRIRIEAKTAPVILSFPSSSGLILEDGQVLAYFGGFSLDGSDAPDTYGVHVTEMSHLDLDDVTISNFGRDCLLVNESSNAIASDLEVSSCGSNGVNVSSGSLIWASEGKSTGNGLAGWDVDHGSVLLADRAEALGNGTFGFDAYRGSVVYGLDLKSIGNISTGIYAHSGSVGYVDGATVTSNGDDGITAGHSSAVYAGSASVTINTDYQFRSVYGSSIYVGAAAGSDNKGTTTSTDTTGSYIYE